MTTLTIEASEKLQSQGGRMTSQRRIILEALQSLGSHPTADELLALANRRDPNIHLSTVYRTLNWLEVEGLIGHHHFGDHRNAGRFDPALPAEHHHFLCRTCGKVIEFEDERIAAIKREVAARTDCQVEMAAVVLSGLCPDCRKKTGGSQIEKDYP